MQLTSSSFEANDPIPDRLAFATPDPETHVTLSDNLSPALKLSDLPQGTRSLAIVCHDSDVPTEGTDVNQEGRTVPASLARTDFYHWVLVDLPPTLTTFEEGAFSKGVTARGKDDATAAGGSRQGLNDYTGWFASDEDMKGDYYGYDGPGPPWNDEIVHHYHFTAYALDVERLALSDGFTGPQAREAMIGHVLAEARLSGTYTLTPSLRG